MAGDADAQEGGRRAGPYGPNREAVDDLLEAVHRLDVSQLISLASAGRSRPDDPDAEAREALRNELRDIALDADRMDAIRGVNEELETWATSVHHWNPAGVMGSSQSRSELEMRMATVRVILDAAYGTVLADLLEPDEVELLTRAWTDVISDPEGTPVADAPDELPSE